MFQSLSSIHIIGVVCAFGGLNDMCEHTERLQILLVYILNMRATYTACCFAANIIVITIFHKDLH